MQILETSRLQIRVETVEEYVAMFAKADDDTLKAYYGYHTDDALAVQKAKVAGGFTTYRTSLRFFHLVLKETGEVIGSASLHNWYPALHRSETGYEIRQVKHKNKGYMTEALPAVISHGFDAMQLNRIEANTAPDNTPSRRLLEGGGFKLEGHLREHYFQDGMFVDSVIYGLLAREYRLQYREL